MLVTEVNCPYTITSPNINHFLNVWLDRGKVQFTVKEKGQIMVPSIDEANQDKYVRMPQDDSLTRYLETRSADRRWA
jgi:hypothetical protein